MLLDSIFQPFVGARPVAVMARAAMERVLDAERIDRVFHHNATERYEYVLPFSGLVKLLGQVVLRKQPSVNAVYQAMDEKLEALCERGVPEAGPDGTADF